MVHNPVGHRDLEIDEYAARQQRVRQRMANQALDVLLVSDPANLYYLTGYNAWSFYTAQILVLPLEGAPLLYMRQMDAHGAHRTAICMDESNIHGYPEQIVHRPDIHPGDWIAKHLRDLGFGRNLRVGFEGDAHYFSVRMFMALSAMLPEWQLQESRELVNWVRLVKSPYEIELMRAAGKVCSTVMRTALQALGPGRPQNEVAAEIMAAQARGVDGIAGDYASIVPMLPTGEGADTPHLTWTDDPLPVDSPISIELAGVHRRYHAPMARTAVIGKPSSELEQVAAATIEGLESAFSLVRPGITIHEVTDRFTRVIKAAGFDKESRLGYSIGVGFPPDWGERTVSFRAGEHTELQENMTFHLIAGMWLDGYGFEVSEPIRVTATGLEFFADVPRELTTINTRSTPHVHRTTAQIPNIPLGLAG
ncbi:M24 family metallopeptidase [Paeniglutamicibacter sulfureus]|uniref:Xaa-Pro aminopeptidase n=1 Tax=Paeniglutamicibacter sulfureus TaxID=43666 RepID=A0ABU2BHR0_9MICC|nr:Xaa-Pro peptidase family protein [Paeniglutamicibacter sulfureus]MDO2933747.1 Xaa-Pro peptidase family protein [Paeniglutamicibacter sulfureus]MDR7358187.1 Xaa-Pro aminopeptidase [Paeniglutamicibacter sulfureus]